MIRAINAWISNGKIHSYYRDESGEIRFNRPYNAEYTAFTKTKPGPTFMRDTRCTGWSPDVHAGWYKLSFRDYEARKGWVGSHFDLDLYEADVSPIKRWLADNDVKVQRPRLAYLDFETDSRRRFSELEHMRVLSWALTDERGKQAWGMLEEDTDNDEKRLLEELEGVLDRYDCILCWNGDSFDFPLREARLKYHHIRLNRRLTFVDQMLAFRRMNLQTAQSGEEKQSTSLDAVGEAKVGRGKTDFDSSKTWEAWAEGRRKELLKYNLDDTDLQRLIEGATGYIEAFLTICEICNVFATSHSLKPTAQADGWFLRRAREMGTHLPSRIDREEQPQFEGAYVEHFGRKGIMRDAHMLDFAAMYPSNIQTCNMGFDTKDPNGTIVCPATGVRFRDDVPGMVPAALAEFAEKREPWKAKKKAAVPKSPEWLEADRYQNVFKVLSNSMYGLLGSVYSRFYDPDIARSVTQMGVWLAEQAVAELRKLEYRVEYVDTDGILITGCTSDQAAEFARWFTKEFLPPELAKYGIKKSFCKLDYQEAFSKIIFPISDEGEPVAKRYVGRFSFFDGKPVTKHALEIKGLEVKRGDTSKLARRMQQELIDKLMADHEYTEEQYEEWLAGWRRKIFEDPMPVEDVVISKSVKELGSYKIREKKDGTMSPLPAHVRLAVAMRDRGEEVTEGTRVRYVVVDADAEPAEIVPVSEYTGEFDRFHTWNAVYKATMRLIAGAFPLRNWSRWLAKKPKKVAKEQLGLFA